MSYVILTPMKRQIFHGAYETPYEKGLKGAYTIFLVQILIHCLSFQFAKLLLQSQDPVTIYFVDSPPPPPPPPQQTHSKY